MTKPTVGQRLRYAFDNTMSRGAPALVGWLAVVTLALIGLFTAIVLIGGLAPGYEDGSRPGVIRQLYDSFLRTLDPGTVAGDTGDWPFLAAMLSLTLGGILVVSALIGVIATGLDNKLQELRKGRSVVLERDHTLILGWSETIFTILSELAISNESERRPSVVILADRDRAEMEDAVRAKVPDMGKTRVISRTGNPIDLTDLRIVNPAAARSIIILSPDEDEPDAQVIKTILALTREPRRREAHYHIVAEIQDPANLEAARLVGGEETVLVDKRETIARLLVQATRQSGASVVYSDLLDFEGDEIYFRSADGLGGCTFGEALLAYEDCAVIGRRSARGAIELNPPADIRLEAGDELIAIAEDDARLQAAPPLKAAVDEDAIAAPTAAEEGPKRALILGWNSRTPSVIRELDKYVKPGSALTVMADWEPAGEVVAELREAVRNLEISFRRGNTTDRRTLESLEVDALDHVIVTCYADVLDPQRADARTLVTLLHLRDIAERRSARFSITSEMLDDRNRELARVTQVDDVIVSDKVISLLLAQISENAYLKDVFAQLFSAEGSEMYLKPATDYVRAGRRTTFATVVEAARRRDEAAIGYRLSAQTDDASRNYGVRINPPKSEPVDLAEGDRAIVLAED